MAGQRLPPLSDRLNGYGAYDFTHGECLLWEDGWCNGEQTVPIPAGLVSWRAGKAGRLVVIWDNAPCHVAKVVTAEAARLGIEIVSLPGYSPDLNPIERLWDWMREEVTRGFCHASVSAVDRSLAGVHRPHQRRPHGPGRSALAQVRTRPGVRGKTPGLYLIGV